MRSPSGIRPIARMANQPRTAQTAATPPKPDEANHSAFDAPSSAARELPLPPTNEPSVAASMSAGIARMIRNAVFHRGWSRRSGTVTSIG